MVAQAPYFVRVVFCLLFGVLMLPNNTTAHGAFWGHCGRRGVILALVFGATFADIPPLKRLGAGAKRRSRLPAEFGHEAQAKQRGKPRAEARANREENGKRSMSEARGFSRG